MTFLNFMDLMNLEKYLSLSLGNWFCNWPALDSLVSELFIGLLCAYAFLGLDDFLLDLYYLFLGPRPQELTEMQLQKMQRLPQKMLAIMVASWKEENVLQRMVSGNLAQIEYHNYHFFLGVYPNDPATNTIAQSLEQKYPNVHRVENSHAGPTSKGQMLNQIVGFIFAWEKKHQQRFAFLLLHDSEDIIHPKSLLLINYFAKDYDFIQLPIFSLPVPLHFLVAGIYMDEFSESHLKDMLLRNLLNGAFPSAGVGTAMSRHLVRVYCEQQEGMLFNPRTLTEDYELGVSTERFKLKSLFACYFYRNDQATKNYIATREYFPKSFWRSVRQKSRWTLGIAFQGMTNLGWRGSWWHKFYLYRDRKGMIANPLLLLGLLVSLYLLFRPHVGGVHHLLPHLPIFIYINILYMGNRLIMRGHFSRKIYGSKVALLSPLRLLMGNVVNASATLKAWRQFLASWLTGVAPQWLKTEHEIDIPHKEVLSGVPKAK